MNRRNNKKLLKLKEIVWSGCDKIKKKLKFMLGNVYIWIIQVNSRPISQKKETFFIV